MNNCSNTIPNVVGDILIGEMCVMLSVQQIQGQDSVFHHSYWLAVRVLISLTYTNTNPSKS